MLSVKLADLVTAPVTERVAVNSWVPPEAAPVVGPASGLDEPPTFVALVAVLEEPQAAIKSATLASATIPAMLRRTYGSNLIRPFRLDRPLCFPSQERHSAGTRTLGHGWACRMLRQSGRIRRPTWRIE